MQNTSIISARVPEEWAELISTLKELGEIKSARDIIETGLEVFRPTGISAREYHIQILERRFKTRSNEIEAEIAGRIEETDAEILKMRNTLRSLRSEGGILKEKITSLINRWKRTLDPLRLRVSTPEEILKERAISDPKGTVEFFKPFGISISWEEYNNIYLEIKEEEERDG